MDQLHFSDNEGRHLQINDSMGAQIGMLAARLIRKEHEWQMEYCHAKELDHRALLEFGENTVKRIICHVGDQPALIRPTLADRAIVSQLLTAIELLPGADTTIYVSTALWASFFVGEQLLFELPTLRLSDTWFGPNTLTGELSYASTTRARLDLARLDVLPYKAITPIRIRNHGTDNLQLSRINVPVPHLTLYDCKDDFWTSRVTITREGAFGSAKIDIATEAPEHLADAVFVAGPRSVEKRGSFNKALDLLFA